MQKRTELRCKEYWGCFRVGEMNADGKLLVDLCLRDELAIINKYYEHQESHKWSWYRWNSEAGRYTVKSMIACSSN